MNKVWHPLKKGRKISLGLGGFQNILCNLQVGFGKILCMLTRWVGGSKKGPKYAYVIYEWSLTHAVSASKAIKKCKNTDIPKDTTWIDRRED